MRLWLAFLPALVACALPAAAQTVPPEPAADDTLRRVLSVGRGDTLMTLLMSGAEVARADAHEAIEALRPMFDPRDLQVGQKVTVTIEPRRGGRNRLVGLEIKPDVLRSVSVARAEDGFETNSTAQTSERHPVAADGVIRSSLSQAGDDAGVPFGIMMAVVGAFSHDVDFQRDVHPGDRFTLLYERVVAEDGTVVGSGHLLYAMLTLSGREMPIYRFTGRDGRTDYYNREGESIRRALLRTPIDGARITSGFGMRRHPILGFSKMHKGVDFGAPAGTPVYAAGNGVVEEIGRNGSYGNYIRIRHNNDIATAYAHLSRFASGLERGDRVEQGDVIAQVGSTGRSTGPHLHYEVLRHNRQVNPRSVDLPTGQKLEGSQLAAFQAEVQKIERAFVAARGGVQMVNAPAALLLVPRKPVPVCSASGC